MAAEDKKTKLTEADLRRMMQSLQVGGAASVGDDAKSEGHKFWDTQPVPKLGPYRLLARMRTPGFFVIALFLTLYVNHSIACASTYT